MLQHLGGKMEIIDKSANGSEKRINEESVFIPPSNGFYKIRFDKESILKGLATLVHSQITFVRDENGFIISNKHKEILDDTKISYELVK
jgi:hypothetical protein